MEKNHSFYIYLQRRLLELCNIDHVVDIKTARWKIVNMKIPHVLAWSILKDMEQMKLGTRVNKFKFKLENIQKDREIEKIITNHV